MQIILTEEITGVGRAGEIVNVKDGFGRNYLLPKNLAVLATSNNVKALEHDKKIISDRQNKLKREAEKVAKTIEGLSCSIPCQVGEEGKLFGSVTSQMIADSLKEKGFTLDKRQIEIEDSIKALGIYTVPIKLPGSVTGTIKVWVVRE